MAMAKQAKQQAQGSPPWLCTPAVIWWTAILASVAVNLLAVSWHVPLYKDVGGLGAAGRRVVDAKSSKINYLLEEPGAEEAVEPAVATPPTRLPAADRVKEMVAAAVRELDVSSTSGSRPATRDALINLDHGDPTMFEAFWRGVGERGTVVIPGWQKLSYFSDAAEVCWFLEPDFAREIRRLHRLVGNAVTGGRQIVVGTGSTQLFQAAIYALSPSDAPEPMSVVSAAPYYSSYPMVTDYLRSGLFRWAGDAHSFEGGSYIEVVCSPNNPDGFKNKAVLCSESGGRMIHDYAYYWPQYTAITGAADDDIMLFTVSKSTGHAGTRLGWALVRDVEVAKRMTKFMELNTIGVSKDSQLRAAEILRVVSDGYELPAAAEPAAEAKLFEYGRRKLVGRWEKLREVVSATGMFSLAEYPLEACSFTGGTTPSLPAFAWLKCKKPDIEDCSGLLKSHKILTRSGKYFGAESRYTRISMLDRDDTFHLFIERLASIK